MCHFGDLNEQLCEFNLFECVNSSTETLVLTHSHGQLMQCIDLVELSILYIVFVLFFCILSILYICTLLLLCLFYLILLSVSCPVAVIQLHCGATFTKTNSSCVLTYLAIKLILILIRLHSIKKSHASEIGLSKKSLYIFNLQHHTFVIYTQAT